MAVDVTQVVGTTSYRDLGLFFGVMLLFIIFAGALILAAELRLGVTKRLMRVRLGSLLTAPFSA